MSPAIRSIAATKSLERIHRFRREGTTILFDSHDLETVESMCDRVIWLDHGIIMANGNPQEVVRKYRNKAIGN